MSLRALAGWLETLDALRAYSGEGVCTGTTRTAPGCALCDDGIACAYEDVGGGRTEERRYKLYIRAACPGEAERAALAADCEKAAREIAARDAAGQLPGLPGPYTADALRCVGQRLDGLDDSGLAAYEMTLLLTAFAPGGACVPLTD